MCKIILQQRNTEISISQTLRVWLGFNGLYSGHGSNNPEQISVSKCGLGVIVYQTMKQLMKPSTQHK